MADAVLPTDLRISSLVAWYTFLASLVILMFLGQGEHRRTRLNLRIFVLGVCFGSLVLFLTSYRMAAVATAVTVWAPKTIIEWWRWRKAVSSTRRSINPFKPTTAKVRVPDVASAQRLADRPGTTRARAWVHYGIYAFATVFASMFNALDRFNDHVFSICIRLLILRERSRESVHQAVERGDIHKVEKLMRKGASLSDPDGQARTALHVALARLEEVVEEEEDEGEEMLSPTTKSPKTSGEDMVRRPSSVEWRTMIRFLLHRQADVNACDAQGHAPIHIAVRARFHDVVRGLVDASADPTLRCKGTSTLHQAAAQRDAQMVGLLLEAATTKTGAPRAMTTLQYVNGTDRQGWTALGLAARAGDAAVVKALLDAGADRDTLQINGKNALEIAKLNKRAAVVKLLES